MDLPPNYLDKFKKPETPYDICKDIADCIHRPVGTVLGLTAGWSMHQLVKAREIAQKDAIEFWKYRKAMKVNAVSS
jgi:hypothetical protein